MNVHNDDTFLGRWLNNELTEEELREFEASDEYPYYQKIVEASRHIDSPEFNKDDLLSAIREKIGHKRSAKPAWWYAVAASVLLVAGFFTIRVWMMEDHTVILSGAGEKMEIILPDGSVAVLSSRTRISYQEDEWDTHRTLKLEGQAFFDVEKGRTFEVNTKNGDVRVLGTEFNVITGADFFEVACYEGSVEVSAAAVASVLSSGEIWRKIGDSQVAQLATDSPGPTWLNGESTFREVPLKYVLRALEDQFDVEFKGDPKKYETTFSGAFPHDDLRIALRVVLGSLQIDYQLEEENTVYLQD